MYSLDLVSKENIKRLNSSSTVAKKMNKNKGTTVTDVVYISLTIKCFLSSKGKEYKS